MTTTDTRTYAQYRSHVHSIGGETQAEATAKMSDAVLRKATVGFLNSILGTLGRESARCHTMDDYTVVRAQVDRVRAALNAKGSL